MPQSTHALNPIKPLSELANAVAMATDIDTPYFETNLQIIRDQAKKFQDLFPQIKIHYAVKSNNDSEIIHAINPLAHGFDVASFGEVRQLLELGIAANRLLFSNPVKIPRHIQQAHQSGVRNFSFDSLVEIEKIKHNAPGSNVYLRIKVSDHGSKFPLSKKFGIDPRHALEYCTLAEDAGLHVVGITFHVGSQSENPEVWDTAIGIAGKTIEALREGGIAVDFLNIGGGFPADYGQPIPGIEAAAAVINQSIVDYLPSDIEIYAEPGRYMVAESTVLVTTVIGREHRSGVDWLYLDVGTFQGLIEPLEMPDIKYQVTTDKDPKGYKKSFVLTGPSCDACDTIGLDYLLPSDINVGDKVYIHGTGAYTRVYASNFNGFDIPEVRYIDTKRSPQ